MKKKPDITISTLDLDRLYDLIESLPNKKNIPGIDELEKELDRAQSLDPKNMPPSIVTMNSTVKFIIQSTQKEFELTLVYPKDIDETSSKVSILAPVGSALLGLSIGEEIEWPKPGGGNLKVRIKDITFQPERSGNYHI